MPTPDASQYIHIKRLQAAASASAVESPLKFRAPIGLSGYGFIPGLKARFGPNALTSNKFIRPRTTTVDLYVEITNILRTCGTEFYVSGRLVAEFGVDVTNVIATNLMGTTFDIIGSNTAEFIFTEIPSSAWTTYSITLPISFSLNDGRNVANGEYTLEPITSLGSPSQSPQLYSNSPSPPFTTGGSINFVGELDGYVCAGANSGFAIPSATNFTVMWWQYLDTNGSSNQFPRPFSMGNSTSGDVFTVSMEGSGATKTIYVWINGSSRITVSTSVGNAWHHFAVIRYGDTISLYKNGVSIGSATFNTAVGNSTVPLILGQRYTRNNQGETFVGYISKFVFDNGAARYTTDFSGSLPLADPTPIGEGATKLILLCSNAASVATDSSGQENDIGFYGNTISNTPGFSFRPPTPISWDTTYNSPITVAGENNTYTTASGFDFTAEFTSTYKIVYTGITGSLRRVIISSSPNVYITNSTIQTPNSFASNDTISLTAGQHLYLMPSVDNNSETIALRVEHTYSDFSTFATSNSYSPGIAIYYNIENVTITTNLKLSTIDSVRVRGNNVIDGAILYVPFGATLERRDGGTITFTNGGRIINLGTSDF